MPDDKTRSLALHIACKVSIDNGDRESACMRSARSLWIKNLNESISEEVGSRASSFISLSSSSSTLSSFCRSACVVEQEFLGEMLFSNCSCWLTCFICSGDCERRSIGDDDEDR